MKRAPMIRGELHQANHLYKFYTDEIQEVIEP